MILNVKEMHVVCAFHSGTVSATLSLLRQANEGSPEKKKVIESVIEKLSGLKEGEPISLAFDPE